jgi:hypothetical protein
MIEFMADAQACATKKMIFLSILSSTTSPGAWRLRGRSLKYTRETLVRTVFTKGRM